MATLRSLVLALLLSGGAAAFPVGASSMSAEFGTSSYSGPVGLNPALYALEQQPLWRAPLDEFTATIGPEAVFFLSGGQLEAKRLATGETIWRYGSNISGPAVYAASLVLLAEAGQLVALDALTGRKEWRRDLQLQRITQFMSHGSLLLVVGGRNDAAVLLNVATGSELYRYDLPGIAWPVFLTDTVLYLVESFGEPSFRSVSAHDVSAGKELWRASSTGGPIWREDGWVYLNSDNRRLPAPGSPVPAQIKVLAERSGELLDTWSFATDGLFQVVQLVNGRQRFFVRTGAAGFGPTLRSGTYLILQTPTELLVVEDIQ